MPSGKHKNPHYALRIPPATMNKLKYIAGYNSRSANKEIEHIILRYIADFERKNGAISPEDLQAQAIRQR